MIGSEAIHRLTGRDFATVPQVWAARVQATPERIFLRWSGRCWTYAEAWRAIETLAAALPCPASPGLPRRIAGYLGNSPDTLWAWFGTLRAGASYVALNRGHKGALLQDMMNRCSADVLVTDRAGTEQLEALNLDCFRWVVVLEEGGLSDARSNRLLEGEASLTPMAQSADSPFQECGVIYTSGSTGRSKAVRLAHAAITHGAGRMVEACEITVADVYHGWLPHFHIAGQLHQTMATVVAGSQLALFRTFSASQFWDQIREVGATLVIGLPNIVRIMWGRTPDPSYDRSSLRLWFTTAIDPGIHSGFEQRFGVEMLEQYGMTEAELITLPYPGERVPPKSCGRPGPDWDVCVLDDQDRPLQAGTVGQIAIRPRVPGILFLGYDGDDCSTQQALRNAWFHCGDFGYLDHQGYLYFVDRRRSVIRRRGENISSFELERLVESHPAVEACAALGVPSPLGEEDVKIVIQLRDRQRLSPAQLHEYCRATMAAFMVPRYIRIIAELPRTPVGKIDKECLREVAPGEWDAERVFTR